MRKKFLSFVAVIILTLSVCMTALAEGENGVVPPIQEHGGTAAELKSYGKIVYQKGTDTIKIDSDDLYMLADQIDQVKLDVTDQLEALNTYFSTGEGIVLSTSEDINVVHATPTEEYAVDPLDVNFDTLLEGIAVSQSVSPDVTAYGYPSGTELYKTADGLLTTDGSEKGAEQINVTAATADNLSAGTAAWVNGSLILGTGEDNKSYTEDGYEKGLEEGSYGLNRHVINITTNKNVVAPDGITCAFICTAYSSRGASLSSPSFKAPDGSNVPCSQIIGEFCHSGESHSSNWHLAFLVYYVPKLKAGTVITIPSDCPRSYFVYYTK